MKTKSIQNFSRTTPFLRFRGKLISGLGEGCFYLSKQKYRQNIQKSLGYTPFPGTLNVKLLEKLEADYFKKISFIHIRGFYENKRKFYYARCYPCLLFFRNKSYTERQCSELLLKTNTHIIIPKINKHNDDVLEIIAPFSFRERYNLQDGDSVEILTYSIF